MYIISHPLSRKIGHNPSMYKLLAVKQATIAAHLELQSTGSYVHGHKTAACFHHLNIAVRAPLHCCSFCLFTADASRNHHLPGRSCKGCWCRCEWISGVLYRTGWWQGAWHRWRCGSKPDQRGRRCRLLLHKPAASRTSHRQQESRLRTYAALSSYNCSFGKDYSST